MTAIGGTGGEVPALPRPEARARARLGPVRYLARKLGFYLVAAWVAVTANFFLPRLIPGNPVEVILAHQQRFGTVPANEADILTKLLGLGTGSLASRYWQYLGSLAHL